MAAANAEMEKRDGARDPTQEYVWKPELDWAKIETDWGVKTVNETVEPDYLLSSEFDLGSDWDGDWATFFD